jgi:predicted GNAT family acetyltransferase
MKPPTMTVMENGQRSRTEDQLDEALEGTFPASDPPANTVETGIGLQVAQDRDEATSVTDNRAAQRFELVINGQSAFLTYQRTNNVLRLVHTDVPRALRGRHLGERLVKKALDAAQAEGLRVVALCPFVKDYLKKHPGH